MGYYTEYELVIENFLGNAVPQYSLDQIVEELEAAGVIGLALNRDLSTKDSVKWHQHESDMIAVSKKFPSVIFKLAGRGERFTDCWVETYENGSVSRKSLNDDR